MAVRETADGFVAHAVGGFEHDAEDLTLTAADLQEWRLDWGAAKKVFGSGKTDGAGLEGDGLREGQPAGAMSGRERAKKVKAGR